MSAFGGAVITASSGESTGFNSGDLNIVGADRALILFGCEEGTLSPALSLFHDPDDTDVAPDGFFDGSPYDAGVYLDSAVGFINNPAALNVPIRMELVTATLAICGGAFFTDAADIVAGDVGSDLNAGTTNEADATAGNVVTGDLALAILVTSQIAAPTWQGTQTPRGNAANGNYLRLDLATQAGSDGGQVDITFPNTNYGAQLIVVRIPDSGGGGGGGASLPINRLQTVLMKHLLGR